MNFCENCGEKLDDNVKFCPSCGTKIVSQSQRQQTTYTPPATQQYTQQYYQQPMYPPQQPYYQQYPSNNPYNQLNNGIYINTEADKPSGSLNAGLLVWSIINILIYSSTIFGMAFGIISLVFTILAKSAKTKQEEKNKLKVSLILNIVGTSLALIGVLLIFLFMLFSYDLFSQVYY